MANERSATGVAEAGPAGEGGAYLPRAVRARTRQEARAEAGLPLSREAQRVRDGLGVPISAFPGVEREERAYLHGHSQALNRLIVGQSSEAGVWKLLRAHLPADAFEALHSRARVAFSPIWGREELEGLEDMDLRGLEAEWRERMAKHERWSRASSVIREDRDYAAIWRDILGGDFDLRGRGAEYTRGMESFQASRWLGARTLLDVMGARDGMHGIYLDVLGGDGYVWRLLEAEKGVAQARVIVVEDERFWPEEGAEPGAGVRALMERLAAIDPRVVVMLVRGEGTEAEERAGEHTFRGRLVTAPEGELVVSGPFTASAAELMHLVHAGEAARLWATDSVSLEDRAAEFVAAGAETDGGALIVTNDISPHMFYRAGLWGLPSREDATQLSRTFLPDSLDGVLFAYGTHHIPDMFDATREAFSVVKPGAVVVVHDFFDEGPAGQWFHLVVDRHSKTGHDIPHIGPIQMAAVLFAAGFQDLTLHETQDPFFFACDGEATKARDLALSYLLGMYGMEESFKGRLDEFEEVVRSVLTYPEVGETPIFTDGLVYVPRRAVVARGVKPENGTAVYSESDRVLIDAVAALFRESPDEIMRRAGAPEEIREYWFGADGSRWGVSAERQQAWLEWAATVA